MGGDSHPDVPGAGREGLQQDYSNTRAAIGLSHRGGFGFSVDVVVKPTVQGVKTNDLRAVRYDTDTGKFKELKVENARVDSKGYVHFTTTQGGVIILSNGDLK